MALRAVPFALRAFQSLRSSISAARVPWTKGRRYYRELSRPANEQYKIALRAFQEPEGRSRWFQIVPSASRVPGARRASIMNEGEETSGDVLAEEHEFPAFGRMELEGI